jgi:hypothetical protein
VDLPDCAEFERAPLGAEPAQLLYGWRKIAEVGYYVLRLFELAHGDEWQRASLGVRIYKLGEAVKKMPVGAP